MKKKTSITTLILASILLCSCGGGSRENQPSDFISVNIRDVQRRVEVPLSSLIESLEIVHLEDKDEAFSRPGRIYITENFIGRQAPQDAFKLFERTGRFIGNVGRLGQGPGEYASTVYHAQICETAERVYLVTWARADRILTYNLEGQFIENEVIPFAFPTSKVRFFVDNKNKQVVVLTLPFQGVNDYVVWVQDFAGNVIQKVSSEGFALHPDFSNEVHFSGNTPNFDFGIMDFWQGGQDTLFHYDIRNNILRPVFALTPTRPGELIFSYLELPRHFLVDIQTIGSPERSAFGATISAVPDRQILVDKETGEARFVQIVNDFLGNWVIDGVAWRMRNGYFAQSFEPMELQDILEEALRQTDIQPDVRQRMIELNNRLDPNGNDVVMIGRLKQNPATGDFNEVEYFRVQEEETESVVVSDDDRILTDLREIHSTPFLNDGLEYFRENNRFGNWDANDARRVLVRAVINKDGTASYVEVAQSSGVEKLDNEAVRLIKEASYTPGTNMEREIARVGNFVIFVDFPPR